MNLTQLRRLLWVGAGLSLGWAGVALAGPELWRTSHTVTADTTRSVSIGPVVLHGVDVTQAGAAGNTLTLYNSNAVASGAFALIDLTTGHFYPFDVNLSSGLSYTKSGTSAITILWRK